MSQYKDCAIEQTCFFWFSANTTAGTAGDGATPLFDVRLAGATAAAAPVLEGTPTLLTHANYSDGIHEIAVAATAVNGFAAGNEYAVFCTLTISTVNPSGFVGSFKLVAAGKNLHALLDTVATDVAGLDGAAMRGTDSAALASVCTEARLAELAAANLPADVDNLKEAAFIRRNTAQAGAAGSITLDASASATTDFYKGTWIVLIGNVGAGQARLCTAYNGTTKIASIVPNWATNPDVTTTFMVVPAAGVDLEMVLNAVVTGGVPDVNVTKVGGTTVTGPNDLKADVTNLDVAISTRASPADVNTQVDAALDTAIPGSPTADSINERVKAIDDKLPSGTISDVTTAQVNTEVDTALADINLDHLVGTATGIPAVPAGTFLDQMMDDGTAAFDRTTDSMQAIRDNQGTLSNGAITAAKFAAGAIDAAALAADAANEIADAVLSRDVDQVEATAAVHSLATAILKAVSRIRNNAGTLEIYQTNGTTVKAQQTITTDATNEPVDELTAGVAP